MRGYGEAVFKYVIDREREAASKKNVFDVRSSVQEVMSRRRTHGARTTKKKIVGRYNVESVEIQ